MISGNSPPLFHSEGHGNSSAIILGEGNREAIEPGERQNLVIDTLAHGFEIKTAGEGCAKPVERFQVMTPQPRFIGGPLALDARSGLLSKTQQEIDFISGECRWQPGPTDVGDTFNSTAGKKRNQQITCPERILSAVIAFQEISLGAEPRAGIVEHLPLGQNCSRRQRLSLHENGVRTSPVPPEMPGRDRFRSRFVIGIKIDRIGVNGAAGDFRKTDQIIGKLFLFGLSSNRLQHRAQPGMLVLLIVDQPQPGHRVPEVFARQQRQIDLVLLKRRSLGSGDHHRSDWCAIRGKPKDQTIHHGPAQQMDRFFGDTDDALIRRPEADLNRVELCFARARDVANGSDLGGGHPEPDRFLIHWRHPLAQTDHAGIAVEVMFREAEDRLTGGLDRSRGNELSEQRKQRRRAQIHLIAVRRSRRSVILGMFGCRRHDARICHYCLVAPSRVRSIARKAWACVHR